MRVLFLNKNVKFKLAMLHYFVYVTYPNAVKLWTSAFLHLQIFQLEKLQLEQI